MGGRRKDVRVLAGKESRGPGAYNPEPENVKKKTANYTMAKDRKGVCPDVYGSTPGPNNYNPKFQKTLIVKGEPTVKYRVWCHAQV